VSTKQNMYIEEEGYCYS